MIELLKLQSAMSTLSSSNHGQTDPEESLEPSVRIKKLVEMSHNISVDRNISISLYFKSGRELIKSAAALEAAGEIEKAFVLYLRYMTLFLEKLVHHPEYSKADKEEKKLVKEECNNVFDLAEKLKKAILDNYQAEYEKFKQSGAQSSEGNGISKRNVSSQGGAPHHECDIDEIDKKFDFSQGPKESAKSSFDPFNIEELKESFRSSIDK